MKSDDELKRLNEKAREESLKEHDEAAEKQMQRQVARLLQIVGPAQADLAGGKTAAGEGNPAGKRGPRHKPQPIETNEPPTYIKILGDTDEAITFYGGQRRYVRVETDANSDYHDTHDQKKSKINIAVGSDLQVFGTSPLRGGRMRIGVLCKSEVAIGTKGGIRVELYRPGLSTLSDERDYRIVEPPKPAEHERKTSIPRIVHVPVEGPDDDGWQYVTDGLEEDRDIQRYAFNGEMDGSGILTIYYSTVFPRYAQEKSRFEQQSPALAASYDRRYRLWIAVHALLTHQDDQNSGYQVEDEEAQTELQRQERRRLAIVAAMVASQEVKSGINTEDLDEAA